MGAPLILILFERGFVFIMRSQSLYNPYLYIMKYFPHSIENEAGISVKWVNLSALKNKTLFSSMTLV